MYRCFSACLTPCDVLTVKSRAERIETPLLILTAGYFLDASYIAVDDERVICIIDNKTGFCAFWFFNKRQVCPLLQMYGREVLPRLFLRSHVIRELVLHETTSRIRRQNQM